MAARRNSPASKVVIDAFGTVLGKALGFVYRTTGIPDYLESIKGWANSLVDSLMDKLASRIITPIVASIDSAKEAIGDMLKEFAEDVMIILKEIPAGVAQAMALDALKKSFFERAFGATAASATANAATATISGVATGMTRVALNSIMDGIIRVGGQQALMGGHKRTRKSKPRIQRNKITRRKRKQNKKPSKKRSRRIK
jgi:hypothetical protein